MRSTIAVLAALAGLALFPAAAQASTFTAVSAQTSGSELELSFVERGLQPDQNYAYTGWAAQASETFQCYRVSSFTPVGKAFTVSAVSTTPDVRGYTANRYGVVRGFIFLDVVLPPITRCKGPNLVAVPIAVSYTDSELVNVFTFDSAEIPGTVSGSITPD
jgi:hypothetical protein